MPKYKILALIDENNFNWTNDPVIGLVLMSAEHDSFGNPINPDIFYITGKHKVSGMLALFPTERNAKHEFANDILKKQNKFS